MHARGSREPRSAEIQWRAAKLGSRAPGRGGGETVVGEGERRGFKCLRSAVLGKEIFRKESDKPDREKSEWAEDARPFECAWFFSSRFSWNPDRLLDRLSWIRFDNLEMFLRCARNRAFISTFLEEEREREGETRLK